MTETNRLRRDFSFIDLLVALLLVALLGAIALAQLPRARETDNRIRCASNLRQIGQAILLYANENKGVYPRTRFKFDAGKWHAYTNWQSPHPFDAEKGKPPELNDVTAALFLLVRTQDITPEVFVCPSTKARSWDYAPLVDQDKRPGRKVAAQDRANFPSPAFLSYSYANPYPDRKGVENGYKLNQTAGAEFATAADMNPGGEALADLVMEAPQAEMKAGNSPNHAGDGQMVLFGDGHVDYVQNPFVGVNRDNIYTVSGSDDGSNRTSKTILASPRWAGDSVLLPTAQDKGDENAIKFSGPPAPPAADPRERDRRALMAQNAIATLSVALETFSIDTGRYPTTEEGLAALTSKPANTNNWKGPYIKSLPKDPWDNPYQYRFPGQKDKNTYDLWSTGPDAREGTPDDIGNAKP